MPDASWPFGHTTAAPSGHIPRSSTRRHCKLAGRQSYLRATPPARSRQLTNPNTKIIPVDSRYDRGTTGGQVMHASFGDLHTYAAQKENSAAESDPKAIAAPVIAATGNQPDAFCVGASIVAIPPSRRNWTSSSRP